jgi:alkanesulfonate monooxygenase SsuD/methylene tetrahydromethanopterin reductase-like flavin-dependent oxidoreductase (luciferase family)
MRAVYFGRDTAELDRRLNWRLTDPDYADKSLDEVQHILFTQKHEIVGTADMILEQIKAYAAAGVEELMLQWFDLDDIDGLRAFAKSVLPRL